MSTIRPYNKQNEFTLENNSKVDLNMSAFRGWLGLNGWLAVRLQSLGAVVVSMTAAFAVMARQHINPGKFE